MTQQEIQECNKQIVLMLGFTQKSYNPNPTEDELMWCDKKHGLPVGELQFHSDWNWLMEAVEFIEKLGKYSFAIDSHPLPGHTVLIHNATSYGITSLVIPDVTMPDKKEAVFIAVSDFAKLYNNKEL